MNKADNILKNAIYRVLNEGVFEKGEVRPKWKDGELAKTKFITQYIESYDISNGEFPITTIKPTAWKTAIKEILWIYQAQTNDLEVAREKYGIGWWDEFESKDMPGTIGARYGYVVKKYDLINKLIDGLKNNPNGRRHQMNLNQYECLESTDGLWSCAFETLWSVRGEYLDVILIQRSNDIGLAYSVNNTQYVALLMMIAKATGLKPGKYSRFVNNLHIYDRHIGACEQILNRESSEKQPKLIFEPKSDDFYEFTIDEFKVEDYEPQSSIKMEMAI